MATHMRECVGRAVYVYTAEGALVRRVPRGQAHRRAHPRIVRGESMVNTLRLTEVQDQARSALLRSHYGHIDVHVRQSMWATLGAGSEESRVAQGEITQAHRARATLMLDCLRLALPEWEADKRRAGGEILLDPRDEPTVALTYAEAYLGGGMSRRLHETRQSPAGSELLSLGNT